MATSNFAFYETLPNIYFLLEEDFCENEFLDRDNYKESYIMGLYHFKELQKDLEEINDKIKGLYYQLCDSPRDKDRQEAANLEHTKLYIRNGHYIGYQVAITRDYRYINKTHRKFIRNCLIKLCKKYHFKTYNIAYRYSNDETGFYVLKEY